MVHSLLMYVWVLWAARQPRCRQQKLAWLMASRSALKRTTRERGPPQGFTQNANHSMMRRRRGHKTTTARKRIWGRFSRRAFFLVIVWLHFPSSIASYSECSSEPWPQYVDEWDPKPQRSMIRQKHDLQPEVFFIFARSIMNMRRQISGWSKVKR